jgi:hypothetical protein
MNWKEFKDKAETQGITDDMKLYRIEVDSDEMDSGEFEVLLGLGCIGVAII